MVDMAEGSMSVLPSYPKPPAVAHLEQRKNNLDDNRLWCVDCGHLVTGLRCKVHGDVTHIKDRVIPCRARLTAPHLVSIRIIELMPDQNKVAVFARKVIQKKTQFGPYEGEAQSVWTYGNRLERLMLRVFNNDGTSHYLDCSDEKKCNWMMYIRPASSAEEQNLVAVQFKGAIYYIATKAISPNQELRVWYAANLAKAMNLPILMPVTNGQSKAGSLASSSSMYKSAGTDSDEDEDEDPEEAPEFAETIERDNDSEDEDYDSKEPGKKLTNNQSVKLVGSFTADGKFECSRCNNIADSLQDHHKHKCREDETQKSTKLAKDEQKTPKKRGRPKKFLKGDGTKGTGRPRGRPKGSTNSAAKIRKKSLKVRQPKTLHECDICKKAFVNVSKLKVHMFSHSGERPFACSFENCDKAFTSKFKVMRHELIHSSDREHVCIYCLKTFSRKDHLKHHLRIHDPNKAMHQCKECGKMYASSYAYRTHLAYHAADAGQMTCEVCKEDFTDHDLLMKHLKAHAGARSIKDSTEKKQKCPYCDKMFFTQKDVKRHAVVHTKIRDYSCQYCPQNFGRRDHLVRHMKKTHVTNTGEIISDTIKKPTKPGEALGVVTTVPMQQLPTQQQQQPQQPQLKQQLLLQQQQKQQHQLKEQQQLQQNQQQARKLQQYQQIQLRLEQRKQEQQQQQHQQQSQQQQQQQQQQQLQQQQAPQVQAEGQGDTPRMLVDSVMITKLLQSVARGILDPSMAPEEGGSSSQSQVQTTPQPQPSQVQLLQQQQHQQQQVIDLQSQQHQQQLQQQQQQQQQQQKQRQVQQLKQKAILPVLPVSLGSVSVSQPSSMTSNVNILPAPYINYQAAGVPVTPTAQPITTLTTSVTTASSPVKASSRGRTIRSIVQQLAEPVMSGHFVPPFLPTSNTTTQPQPQQTQQALPVQQSTASTLLAQQQLQLQQQQLQQQQRQQQQQQQQQQLVQQQIQQPQALQQQQQSAILNTSQSVISLNNISPALITEGGQMRLPVLQSQFIGNSEQTLRMAATRPGTQQVQLVSANPAAGGQSSGQPVAKQMLVVTPLPGPALGTTNLQLAGGHVLTNYADATKLVLSQMNQQQVQQQPQQQPPPTNMQS